MEVNSPPAPGDASRRVALPMAAEDSLTTAIQTIETFVRQENWPGRLKDAWEKVKGAAGRGALRGATTEPKGDLQEIKDQIQDLTKIVQGLTKAPSNSTSPVSYAAVLKRGTALGLPQRGEMPVPARRSREVIIATGAETPTQKQRSGAEIVRDINTNIQSESVVAARRLQSGDILVTFDQEEAKKKWEKDNKLLQAFGTNGKLRTREYTLIAHGVRVATIDPSRQEKAIADIYLQNPSLQGKVEIVRIGWSKKTLKYKKRTAPLHMGIREPEQANQLIEQGLLLGSELHNCELFSGDCQVTQCFNCHSYKHTAKHCPNLLKCGFCAAVGHKSNNCPYQEDRTKHRCASCKGNHTAWARECSIRKIQAEAARQAYLSRPTRFQVRTKHAVASIPTTSTPQTSFSSVPEVSFASSSNPTTFESTPDSDIEMEFIQPKRKRGRPSTKESLIKASIGTNDIRNIFQLSQNE